MNHKHIAIPLLLALAANLPTFAKLNSEPASNPYIPYNLRTLSSAALEPDTMSAPPTLLPQPASTYDAALARRDDIKQYLLNNNDLNQRHRDKTTAGRPAPAHLHTP